MRETAARIISRAILTTTKSSKWSRSLEQTLHNLKPINIRNSLTPLLVSQVIDPHLIPYPTLSLGFFNWASQQPNFTHSSLSYHSVIKALSLSHSLSPNLITQLLKLVREAKGRSFDVKVVDYGVIVGCLVKMKKTHEGFLMVSDDLRSVCENGGDLMLAGLVSEGRFESAGKVFDEMVKRGVLFKTMGFGLFVWRWCRGVRIEEVFGLVDRVRRNGACGFDGSIVALLIVHGLCEAGRVAEAYCALEELRNLGCKPDFLAYRVVSETYKSKGPGSVFEVQMVAKKKRKLGVAPRSSDYREFILSLISYNLVVEAKQLGRIIMEGNFPIEDDTLNALIGSVSAVDPCSALLFFKFLVESNRMPTLLTLSNLSRNLNKHGKVDDLLDVFHTLSSREYFTNTDSYKVMVSSLCEAGRVREAYELLRDMRKKGHVPDISFYNVLMVALCNEDLLCPAKKLWDEMFACGVGGNQETYNILIKKFVEAGQVDEAHTLFHHMTNRRVMPDTTTYMCLLEGLCEASKIEAAIQTFYRAADQDMTMAETLLNPLVLSLCKHGHFSACSRFLCSNCHLRHPDTHAILLKCMVDAMGFQPAIDHLQQVMSVSPTLLQEISTEIVSLLSSSANLGPILKLLQEMNQNKLLSKDDPVQRVLSANVGMGVGS